MDHVMEQEKRLLFPCVLDNGTRQVMGVPTITQVSWNKTRDFSFHVFSIISQGERGISAYGTSANGSFGATVGRLMLYHMGSRDTVYVVLMLLSEFRVAQIYLVKKHFAYLI